MTAQNFANATSKIKIQMAIAKLKQEATFQSGHWSSAQYFEQDLKKTGVMPPVEIYHKYKIPDGYTEKSYEDYIMWVFSLTWFDSNRILNIPEYMHKITRGTDMSDKEKQDYANTLNETVKDLSDTEKQNLTNWLLQQKQSASQEILNQISLIKSLNPELKDVKIKSGAESDFLIGVTSGFHPEDIKYFLSITDLAKARTENDQLRKKLGMNTYALFMKPERMQKIINAVQEHTKLNTLLNTKVND